MLVLKKVVVMPENFWSMRLLGTLLLVSLLSFFSCDSQADSVVSQESEDVEQISVRILPTETEELVSRLVPEDDTLIKFLFEENDTLGIFPSVGGQVEFPIKEESVGKSNASFTGGGWTLRGGYTYSAYYPFNFYNRNVEAVPISYLGQKQKGSDNRDHLRNYFFFAAPPVTVQDGALNFIVSHQGSVMKLTLKMPNAKTWASVSVYTDAEVFPIKKTINLQEASLKQTPVAYADRVSIDLDEVKTTAENEEIVVWIALPSVTADSHSLYVLVKDSEGILYTSKITKSSYDGEHSSATVVQNRRLPRWAVPTLKEGMNSGIDAWEAGTNIEGTVN